MSQKKSRCIKAKAMEAVAKVFAVSERETRSALDKAVGEVVVERKRSAINEAIEAEAQLNVAIEAEEKQRQKVYGKSNELINISSGLI